MTEIVTNPLVSSLQKTPFKTICSLNNLLVTQEFYNTESCECMSLLVTKMTMTQSISFANAAHLLKGDEGT